MVRLQLSRDSVHRVTFSSEDHRRDSSRSTEVNTSELGLVGDSFSKQVPICFSRFIKTLCNFTVHLFFSLLPRCHLYELEGGQRSNAGKRSLGSRDGCWGWLILTGRRTMLSIILSMISVASGKTGCAVESSWYSTCDVHNLLGWVSILGPLSISVRAKTWSGMPGSCACVAWILMASCSASMQERCACFCDAGKMHLTGFLAASVPLVAMQDSQMQWNSALQEGIKRCIRREREQDWGDMIRYTVLTQTYLVWYWKEVKSEMEEKRCIFRTHLYNTGHVIRQWVLISLLSLMNNNSLIGPEKAKLQGITRSL